MYQSRGPRRGQRSAIPPRPFFPHPESRSFFRWTMARSTLFLTEMNSWLKLRGGSWSYFRFRKHEICKISNAFLAIQGAQIPLFPEGGMLSIPVKPVWQDLSPPLPARYLLFCLTPHHLASFLHSLVPKTTRIFVLYRKMQRKQIFTL